MKTCSPCSVDDHCEFCSRNGWSSADNSDNNDEMDDYIEAQLDKKTTKKGGDGGSSGGSAPEAVQGQTDGPAPSLAMKETKLD